MTSGFHTRLFRTIHKKKSTTKGQHIRKAFGLEKKEDTILVM